MTSPTIVPVSLAGRSYDIVVGTGLLPNAGQWLAGVAKRRRTVVVTDENVAARHLESLQTALRQDGFAVDAIVLPPGEGSKSWAGLERLTNDLLDREVERGDIITALGGGVIGDLTGFAASILRRGVDFIQIPTTLLAQVDSSVGGKTGINTPHGKNLVGAFHQPRLVLADIDMLDTLPDRQMRAGYAEVLKYGLLGDAAFFDWLEQNGHQLLAGDRTALIYAVVASCRAKAAIVAADERESGQRALLNLGHTFGHALEAETGFSDRLLHGEAVATGMGLAFELSARLGLCPETDVERVRNHVRRTGLPVTARDITGEMGASFDAASLRRHMNQDKKVADGQITFVLAEGIGRAILRKGVPDEILMDVLRDFAAS
jgi:3-dehydroquinate synthase